VRVPFTTNFAIAILLLTLPALSRAKEQAPVPGREKALSDGCGERVFREPIDRTRCGRLAVPNDSRLSGKAPYRARH
jgi:hypothetical protein